MIKVKVFFCLALLLSLSSLSCTRISSENVSLNGTQSDVDDETILGSAKDDAIAVGSWLFPARSLVDLETLEFISDNYAKDKNNVYFDGPHGALTIFKNVDQTSFHLIDEDLSFGLDQNYVYAGNNGKYEVDSSTFEILNDCYARDKNQIFSITYFYGAYLNLLQDADPTTLQILDECTAKDKDTVFTSLPSYEGTLVGAIEGADAPSFEMLDGFSRDKNRVYIGSTVLDLEVDAASFQRSDDEPYYFYDKNAVFLGYLELERYEGIDQPSFKITYKAPLSSFTDGTVLLKAEDQNHHYELVAIGYWFDESMWVYNSELHQTKWVTLD